MKSFFLTAICLLMTMFFVQHTHAQEVLLKGDSTSMVNVYGDVRLASAHQLPGVKPQKTYNTEGYKIVIYRGDVKNEAQKNRSNFSKKYPKIESLIYFNAPTYYVRIGNFITEEEAQNFLNTIIDNWPNAVIIEDQIKVTLQ